MKSAITPSSNTFLARTALLAAAALLAACGGGSSGDASSIGASEVAQSSSLDTACVGCGAFSATAFTPGVKAGVWSYSNDGSTSASVPVSISGLTGQNVTLVLTNGSSANVSRVAQAAQTNVLTGTPSPGFARWGSVEPGPFDRDESEADNKRLTAEERANRKVARQERKAERAENAPTRNRDIDGFNNEGWLRAKDNTPAQSASKGLPRASRMPSLGHVAAATVGTARAWTDCQDVDTSNYTCRDSDPNRATTLVTQTTTTDGRKINVWVQDTERGVAKVTDTAAAALATLYAQTYGVHESLKTLGGEPWGAHLYPSQLIEANQPVNIVLLNLTPDGEAYGLLGYFWSVNNLKTAYVSFSNEAVAVFLDTETLYLDGNRGLNQIKSTLTHEGTHMTNFYRRGVTMVGSPTFETWLEELTAMAAEDITSERITPGFNNVRDSHLPDFLNTDSFNCSMTAFSSEFGQCSGYSVAGSFGGYLLRQLGVPFYRDLLASPETDSVTALDKAIQARRPGSSMKKQLAEWARVTAAQVSVSDMPGGFGYPALLNSVAFNVPEIDLSGVSRGYTPATQASPPLKAYASASWERRAVTGTFTETVQVPAGVTLSVVIPNIYR